MRVLCLIAIAGLRLEGQAQKLTFDVASVKAVPEPYLQIAPKRSGGRISWTTDLRYPIGYAYRIPSNRMSGPIPGSNRIYQVDATTRPDASDDEVRRMFQSLLTDRFKMASRRVTTEADRYLLTVGKGGLKIRESATDETPSATDGRAVASLESAGVGRIAASKCSMSAFTDTDLSPLLVVVQRELGLRLEKQRGPVETLVVDRIDEQPTEN